MIVSDIPYFSIITLYAVLSFSYIFHIAAIQTALAIAIPEDMSGATNSTSVIMEEEAQEAVVSSTGIQWNMYTATGWISCILGLINFVLFLPYIFQVSLRCFYFAKLKLRF